MLLKRSLFGIVLGAAVVGCFVGCSDVMKPRTGSGDKQQFSSLQAEAPQAFPGQTGELDSGYYHGGKIYYNRINGQNVFQGDIVIPESQISKTQSLSKTSAIRTTHLWPNNVVFYTVDANLRNPARVTSAINHWMSNTNLAFVQRTNQPNFIRFQQDPADDPTNPNDGGCWGNSLGMSGNGEQDIWLSDWGTNGTVIHEIGHAVNLFHEQCRTDQSTNITIVWANILHTADPQTDWWSQFYTFQQSGYNDGANNGAFDFNSIMLYSCYAGAPCAINPNLPIMTRTNGTTWTSNTTVLSAGDIAGINTIYPLDLNATILGVGTNNLLYRRNILANTWVQVPNSAYIIDVCVMRDGTILGVGTTQQLYTKSAINNSWVAAPNTGGAVKSIAIMLDGTILGVGTNNQLYTRANLNSSWIPAPNSGAVTSISIMPNGTILGVGSDYQLYTRATLNSLWASTPNMGGQVISVTIMPDGSFLGVGKANNQLYTRANFNSGWVQIPNSGAVIEVSRGIGR